MLASSSGSMSNNYVSAGLVSSFAYRGLLRLPANGIRDEKQAEREEDSFGASSSPSPRTMPRVTSRRAVRNTATFAAAVPSPKGRPRPYSDTADRGSPDPTFATYQPPVYRKTGREHAPQVLRSELDGERHLLRSSEHAPIAQMSTVPSYTKEATAEPVDGFIEEFDDDDDDDDEYQEPRPRRPIFIKRTRPHQTVNYATEVSGSPIRQSGDTYTKSIFATPAWERVPKRQSTNTPESHRKRPRYLH